ncbi:MAG: MupA/Atu3671 family FMN-dependent luciferase-like monooxygenase, partial [Polyangiales bacterium]
GMYTPVWALIRGASRYGVSFHEIAGGIDEGDILVERRFDLEEGETSLSLNAKNFEAAIDAFIELVERVESGNTDGASQDLSLRNYFGRFRRPPSLCVVDFEKPASETERLVRALYFGQYPNPVGVAKIVHGGRALVVGEATAVDSDEHAAVGALTSITDDGLTFQTSEGLIDCRELRTLDGAPSSGPDAATHLRLTTGDVCAGPSAAQRDQWTSVGDATARGEARWLKPLRTLEPVDFPFWILKPESESRSARARRTVTLPHGAEASDADGLMSMVALFLARLTRQESFDLGLLDLAVMKRASVASVLFRCDVPCRIPSLNPNLTIQEASDLVRKAIERSRRRGPVLHDVAHRYPDLPAEIGHEEKALLPVMLGSLGEGVEFAESRQGVGLAFLVDAKARTITLDFDARSISETHADRTAGLLGNWLARVTHDPSRRFREVSLLSEDEHREIIENWNATDRTYPSDQTLVSLFESQADKSPHAVAVVCEGQSLTYGELNARANQLAGHLRGLGVGPDVVVGAYVPRSLDMIVAIYGIMKAGGAYLPLDPSYPAHRIAFMIEDSRTPVVLTHQGLASNIEAPAVTCVALDGDWARIERQQADNPPAVVSPGDLAYLIYTSGSTGKPKGVMVEHRNVVNFFAGMDDDIAHDPPGTWLAVTSLSFDISVLELLWTLCRGFKVVLHVDTHKGRGATASREHADKMIDFGMFFWGNDEAPGSGKYELMIETAKFADDNGFAFVSTPERHFHAFGGPFPNPSVTSAALAMVTEHVQIRSGSVVLPLHHPVRVAEDWAVVDNLSDGRVALAFAAGWQPNDFVIRPESFANAKAGMFENIDVVRRLWRGEAVEFENPKGDMVPTATLPRPVQGELPVWVTTAGNVETYRMAGRAGANVLTHLLGQSVDQVAEKVQAYRDARKEAGLDPETGKVTLMLHTLVGENEEEVRELVRQPMKNYLKSSVALIKGFAWSFPAFKRPEGVSRTDDLSFDHLSPEEMDALIDHAFERYYENSGLFGTPDRCIDMVNRVREAGIDEIACLVDYGVPAADVHPRLPLIAQVMQAANASATKKLEAVDAPALDYGLAALVTDQQVTHFQCTPSMAKMMTLESETRAALGRIPNIMIGGEAFPVALAQELDGIATGTVTNMYGPTETTIWSSTQRVFGKPEAVHVGRPIANTQFYIVDLYLQPTPLGVPGELLIGGDGVTRGYYERPDLTAERFVTLRLGDGSERRAYRTGDLARYMDDGTVDLLGRIDFQVKIRGHRIELSEIEALLSQQLGVRECVVTAQPDSGGDLRLVGYLVTDGNDPGDSTLRAGLRERLPEYMIPSVLARLPQLPLTPNGKIDRKALKPPHAHVEDVPSAAPEGEIESKIAEVWKRTLELPAVGRDHNFFDLGGHSLLAVQTLRVLQEALDHPVSLIDMYRFPTVASLAGHLSGDTGTKTLDAATDRGARRRRAMARRRRSD